MLSRCSDPTADPSVRPVVQRHGHIAAGWGRRRRHRHTRRLIELASGQRGNARPRTSIPGTGWRSIPAGTPTFSAACSTIPSEAALVLVAARGRRSETVIALQNDDGTGDGRADDLLLVLHRRVRDDVHPAGE
ncbi:MAG: hypothetical protein MZU84_07020 [Sphingobacterium sp.]|nr:hypothetical protein [Sphingobacterium sp.]